MSCFEPCRAGFLHGRFVSFRSIVHQDKVELVLFGELSSWSIADLKSSGLAFETRIQE